MHTLKALHASRERQLSRPIDRRRYPSALICIDDDRYRRLSIGAELHRNPWPSLSRPIDVTTPSMHNKQNSGPSPKAQMPAEIDSYRKGLRGMAIARHRHLPVPIPIHPYPSLCKSSSIHACPDTAPSTAIALSLARPVSFESSRRISAGMASEA